MTIFYLISGSFLGYLLARVCCGHRAGQRGKLPPINKIRLHNKEQKKLVFHFHHYMMSLSGMIVLTAANIHNLFVWGILVGGFIQGILYRDFYKIIYWENHLSIS